MDKNDGLGILQDGHGMSRILSRQLKQCARYLKKIQDMFCMSSSVFKSGLAETWYP